MADEKISQLTAVTSPASTDVVPIVSGGATKKVTIADLVANSGEAITNSAGANVVPKSDGTDLVASRITDDGTDINVETGSGIFSVGDSASFQQFRIHKDVDINGYVEGANTAVSLLTFDPISNNSTTFNLQTTATLGGGAAATIQADLSSIVIGNNLGSGGPEKSITLTADPTTGVIALNASAVNANNSPVVTNASATAAINKAASANVRNSHDVEATHTGDTAYTKAKTIALTYGLIGAARFLFDLKTSNILNTANAKILRNGTDLIGAEQSNVTGVYATKSQDVTQTWNPGDTVELWVKIDDAAQTVSVRNFRIAYDDAPLVAVASVNTTP